MSGNEDVDTPSREERHTAGSRSGLRTGEEWGMKTNSARTAGRRRVLRATNIQRRGDIMKNEWT